MNLLWFPVHVIIKCPWLQSGLPRYIAICDISRYFLYIAICDISRYRDMRYIAIFFCSYRDTNVHGYTEIDGRIDGESRKYTNSHSA